MSTLKLEDWPVFQISGDITEELITFCAEHNPDGFELILQNGDIYVDNDTIYKYFFENGVSPYDIDYIEPLIKRKIYPPEDIIDYIVNRTNKDNDLYIYNDEIEIYKLLLENGAKLAKEHLEIPCDPEILLLFNQYFINYIS